jgi:GT2 family glycosyltransferase
LSVAVLIVNFRVYDELDAALASLDRALDPADEVIVIDQESDAVALAGVAAHHPRVVMVPQESNTGFAAGVNAAVRRTSAPLLLWLNPDTRVDENAVRVLERWMRDHPETGVAGPRVLNEDGSVQPSARRFPGPSTALGGRTTWLTRVWPGNWLTRRNLSPSDAAVPAHVDWLTGACLMTRRDLFDRLGGLDESFVLYWEDADYCRRAAALGSRSTYVPAAVVRHFGGRSAAKDAARSTRLFHSSAYRLYRKHAGPGARLLAPFARMGLWLRGELLARRADRAARSQERTSR